MRAAFRGSPSSAIHEADMTTMLPSIGRRAAGQGPPPPVATSTRRRLLHLLSPLTSYESTNRSWTVRTADSRQAAIEIAAGRIRRTPHRRRRSRAPTPENRASAPPVAPHASPQFTGHAGQRQRA
jgi:hypothetical protein